MSAKESNKWLERANEVLRQQGYQGGGARKAVLELISSQNCALTALEIEDRLSGGDRRVGRASIYRALDNLLSLGLVRRIERGAGSSAAYERIEPSGEHHHHFVCDSCGALVPFADDDLERTMKRIELSSGFQIREHDVVLRGLCRDCRETGGDRAAR